MRTGSKLVLFLGVWVVGVLTSASVVSQDITASRLEGAWQIDLERTKKFNESKVKLSQDEINYMACGQHRMEFKDGVWLMSRERAQCELNGKLVQLTSYSVELRYEVVSMIRNVLAYRTVSPDGSESLDIIYFKNENSFWQYHYYDGDSTHLRVFFERIK